MSRKKSPILCLGACLALMACPSGPSSSGPDEAAAVERKADHIEGLLARRPLAARVLDELMSALPDRAWLTEVAYDSGRIRLKGNAASNNLLADYVSRLEGRPSLTNLTLRSSLMKIIRGREFQEFALEALVPDAADAPAPSGKPPAARLEELEKALPAGQDSATTLREIQRLAVDSGLRMTRFEPGVEVPGEFTSERSAMIEVSGSRGEFRSYLRGLADLAGLWVVGRFSFKAVSGDDAGSEIRASITAKTYLLIR